MWTYYMSNHLLGNEIRFFFTLKIQTSKRIWKPFTVGPEIAQNILVCHMGSCLPWNSHTICSNRDGDTNHCCIYISVNKKPLPLISFKTSDHLENSVQYHEMASFHFCFSHSRKSKVYQSGNDITIFFNYFFNKLIILQKTIPTNINKTTAITNNDYCTILTVLNSWNSNLQ